MKKTILLLLSLSLLLCGCGSGKSDDSHTDPNENNTITATDNNNSIEASLAPEYVSSETTKPEPTPEYHVGNVLEDYVTEEEPDEFYTIDDPALLSYVQDHVYTNLLNNIDESKYFVENVETKYISKEYLEELSYNSKENIFFGYTLSELDDQFKGKRYVFTLGEDGTTQVKEFEEYSDDTYEKALKNVAIGSGVILVCVTVSALTAGAAPAVSVILAASAKTGAAMALSSGAMASISSAIITGVTTGDMEQAMKAAASNGSNAFKWGAISGALAGGAMETIGLYGATVNQLTMNEAAIIQRETNWPLDVIKNLHSMEEYDVYRRAGVIPIKIDGNWAFLQNVDWNFADEDGITNLSRVLDYGNAPIGPDGRPFELHHIGQRADSPLAILTRTQHHTAGDYGIIHYAEQGKNVPDPIWAAQKREFWKKMVECYIETKGLS